MSNSIAMIKPAKIQVRFSDLDVLGHVNNNIYFSYFEMGRIHYFAELLGVDWDWKVNTAVLAKNEVEYIRPVLLGDSPEITVFCEHLGTKSFTLCYELTVNGIIFAKGKSVLVAYDGISGKSVEIHPFMRDGLAKILKS
ncbi:MAG: thioesterase family protein [Bacteroidota bacterium]